MPLGQMPCLEVDGKRVHQSLAICRYIAKLSGVAGSNPFEDLQIDAIVDTINEFRLSEWHEWTYQNSIFIVNFELPHIRNRYRLIRARWRSEGEEDDHIDQRGDPILSHQIQCHR